MPVVLGAVAPHGSALIPEASTDAGGAYTIDAVPPGTYVVQVVAPVENLLDAYHGGSLPWTATTFAVSADAVTTVGTTDRWRQSLT